MWLEMMMQHHQGAVEMAQTEIDQGTFPDAVSLASRSCHRSKQRSTRLSSCSLADRLTRPREGDHRSPFGERSRALRRDLAVAHTPTGYLPCPYIRADLRQHADSNGRAGRAGRPGRPGRPGRTVCRPPPRPVTHRTRGGENETKEKEEDAGEGGRGDPCSLPRAQAPRHGQPGHSPVDSDGYPQSSQYELELPRATGNVGAAPADLGAAPAGAPTPNRGLGTRASEARAP